MTAMETKDRYIIFVHNGNHVLELPFDSYEPGDIKETRERLAQELNCSPKNIEIRITGLTAPKLRVIDGNAGRSRNK
jgi:hypothetical protein